MFLKILLWLLKHTLAVALKLNRHIKIIDDKVCFVCPEDPDSPDVLFDIEAFYDAYFEETE